MSLWVYLRLVLSVMILGLGVLIIARSLWWVVGRGLGWEAFLQPLVIGLLMIGLGLARLRWWLGQGRLR
ncbi:MAG: hypothetical protein C4313_07470 [Thermoflexus sp.]|uniref:hypothetical protein n=1 Tax=Thermoflexus sp. TaxID=1969742 RepID=UPI0033197937